VGEPAGVDLLGGGVQEAVEGGDQPVAREVGAEVAVLLAAGDEVCHPGEDAVVVPAELGRREIALGGDSEPAVLVQDPPGRANELAEGVGCGGQRIGVDDQVCSRDRLREYGLEELLPRGEVGVEGDPADTGGAGDGAHADVGIAAEAGDAGVDDRGDAALGVGPAGPRRSRRGVAS